MQRRVGISIIGLALLVAPATALAACKISKFLDIPVTIADQRAVVAAQINGRDARFMLDSGAFFSTISAADAAEFGLSVKDIVPGLQMKGIGGSSSLRAVTARTFSIAGLEIPRIQFAVGGSDTGFTGLLGQNILGLSDAEYDLPHGIVRLMKSEGCAKATLAYWADTKPFTLVRLERPEPGRRHTIGTVTVNGVPMKALFDTGAQSLLMSLSAARRAGIAPGTAGVKLADGATGIGARQVPTWRARLNAIDLGGETIKNPWVTIIDQSLELADLIIGIDFFLTHRIYVDNAQQRMFVTYEGGPFFGLSPRRAVDDSGAVIDLTDKADAPVDAAGYSRRGAVLASTRKFDAAIADFDKAIDMAPREARYRLQRGLARLENRQMALGTADLDAAVELAPDDPDIRLARVRLRLVAKDPAAALVDLKAADAALAASAQARLTLAGLYDAADQPADAIASYDQWLKSHPEDSGRAAAFNGRCWARGRLNIELDKALPDCEAALRLRPGETAFIDSRALVRLRRGEFDKALADYNTALAAEPRNAWSLFARSITHSRLGNAAAADADRAAALKIDPAVADLARRYGLAS